MYNLGIVRCGWGSGERTSASGYKTDRARFVGLAARTLAFPIFNFGLNILEENYNVTGIFDPYTLMY